MSLVQRISSDVDLLSLHQFDSDTYPYLLQTALKTSGQHFDILFAFPEQTLLLESGGLTLTNGPWANSDAGSHQQSGNIETTGNDFLDSFDQWWHKEKSLTEESSALPFTGGWFVFLSYELVGQIEHGLKLPANRQCEPIAYATRIPAALIKDHGSGQLYAVAENGRQTLIDTMLSHVQHVLSESDQPPQESITIKSVSEENPDAYLSGVDKIKTYIKNGDVFQVNLSRWWTVEFNAIPPEGWLYRQLRIHNPSPFFGLAKFGGSTIISSSPERLVKIRQRQISTRPIAGTRPRGEREQLDHQLREELLAHPKERAEHIMLIDLERNDLGRICEPGSIKVDELMVLETYSHVHHIVSNISGQLRDDITPGQAIRAMFPGGTITGCPKVRCMEIIAELEATGRGAYTGSMGYINLNGDMDFNILIRTMVQCEKNVHFRAGAGIVADSIAENELAESRAKAKGLLNSLGLEYNRL
jgi:anthranilate synthase component 1